MDATSITMPAEGAPLGIADAIALAAGTLGARWSALHEAAAVVGGIAGIAEAPLPPAVRRFPEEICAAGGWRRDHAAQGIADLSAIMEPGLAALLTAHASGVSPVAAAQALWREFHAARDALLLLRPLPAPFGS